MHRKYIIIIGLLSAILFLCACGEKAPVLFTAEQGGEAASDGFNLDAEAAASSVGETEEKESAAEAESEQAVSGTKDKLAVYVCGAVREPDVYFMEAGSIKQDALEAAGGFAEGAATEYVNLAEELNAGERLYFPYLSELAEDYSPLYESENTAETASDEEGGFAEGRLNLNTATKEELMTLPGIGENKAEAIIRYRETEGVFRCIEDIMNIQGIKEGVYGNIKEFIYVD